MNIIGIDVSRGNSHATLLTTDFERIDFSFKHNRSGFKQLADYLIKPVLVIFETTGVYSAQLSRYLKEQKVEFCELNPLEAKMRMESLRRNKTDTNDAFKLALLGVTQLGEIKGHGRHCLASRYETSYFLAAQYHKMIDERTRIENQLRAALELSFPELNNIFPIIRSVLALKAIRLFAHPDFITGLTARQVTNALYQLAGKHITKANISGYGAKIWLAAKSSYPAITSDSVEITIIDMLCDEIESYNEQISTVKERLIKNVSGLKEFKIICSIPGTGQLNTALLIGFVGDISRFDNYKQLNAFLGIDLNRYQSGTLSKQDKINRRGNSYARSTEVEMLQSMLRNKARIQNHLVDYYYKLKKPPYSKQNMVAQIACINHLNRTIIQLVHTNQLYNYQKATRK